jgi:tetratricopeptide (TPR) repeat protein
MKDLPPGAGAMMEEAARADVAARLRQRRRRCYQEILQQDENNVYVLGYLAQAQFGMGQLDECEKTVARALALDPGGSGQFVCGWA